MAILKANAWSDGLLAALGGSLPAIFTQSTFPQ